MKVLVGTGGDTLMEALRAEFGDVEFVPAGSPEERVERIRVADAYYGPPLSVEAFGAAKRLRWIQHIGTGVDWLLDLPELVDSDVVLTNCRGPHADPMADHVVGMMVSLAHRMWEMRDDQRAHRWMTSKYDGKFVEIARTNMGILGLGDIGMAIARRALGFEMKVYAVDKHPRTAPPGVEEVWGLEMLDELLSISDWFVVAAPFTPDTEGLIDAGRLAALKNGAYVIAISRGGIIDEAALVAALRSGRVSGCRSGCHCRGASARGQPAMGHGERGDIASRVRPYAGDVERAAGDIQGEPLALPVRRALPVRLRQARGVLGNSDLAGP